MSIKLKDMCLAYIENKGRKLRNRRYRKRLKNTTFSIISSNCNGGVMTHDLGMKFNTPFISVGFLPKDFIKLLKNPKHYLYDCELEFIEPWIDGCYVTSAEDNFPVGMLDDITLYFPHDHSREEAANKWNKRKTRMNWDNVFIVFTDRDRCTYEDIAEFDKLPYKNKVIFTHKEYPEFRSSFYIRGFEDKECVGYCSDYKNKFGKRYLDDFDYVEWLNKGM